MVICLLQDANYLCIVQLMLMPLPPHHLLLIKIQIHLTLLVLAYPGCPRKKPLNGCLSVSHYNNDFYSTSEEDRSVSIGLAIFTGLTSVTDRPTDYATRSITIDCIYVRSTCDAI